jgi:hypothetical protein
MSYTMILSLCYPCFLDVLLTTASGTQPYFARVQYFFDDKRLIRMKEKVEDKDELGYELAFIDNILIARRSPKS